MATVSCVTFHYVLRALQAHCKISIDEMLQVVDLDKDIVLNTDSQIDTIKLSTIFEYCMKKNNDYTLSLKIGSSITYHSLGILGYLLLNTNSLKEMIEKFNYYQKLISGFMKFHLDMCDDYYKLTIYINENPTIVVPNYHAEVHLSAILSILSQIIGERIIPNKTYFTQNAILDKKEYEKIFGSNIFCGESENAIFFDNQNLSRVVENSNSVMLEYFQQQANKILDNVKNSSYYNRVKDEILKNIGEYDITISFIAKKLNVSERTLQNNLKKENKKFRDALLSIRMSLANHYIKNSDMDISSISLYLGYNEPSSFFRAYKKYFKNTPKQFLGKKGF